MAYNSKSQLTKELSRQELKGQISLTNQSKRDLLSCRPGSREGGKEGRTEAGKQAGRAPYELLAGWQTGLCSSGFNGSGPLV